MRVLHLRLYIRPSMNCLGVKCVGLHGIKHARIFILVFQNSSRDERTSKRQGHDYKLSSSG